MNREPINLIYFGRITESKNVDVVIKVLSILIQAGYHAKLDLIGGCSQDYKRFLIKCEEKESIPVGKVCFHGKHDFDYISKLLTAAHYFVFPSTERKEGHSNSLTEAMAFGVVPIVSRAGFNESICGDNRLVVGEFTPQGFADRIIEIETMGEWDKWSHYVYKRVVDNYTEKQALMNLKQVVTALEEKDVTSY